MPWRAAAAIVSLHRRSRGEADDVRDQGRDHSRNRAPRRAHRRRRHLRHRRRPPPAGQPARQELRDPRDARGPRRHLGPVPLPGYPLGLGPAHLRLRVQAVDGREGDRRRPLDQGLRARDGRGGGHRSPDPLRVACAPRRMVESRGAVDGDRRARRDRRELRDHGRLVLLRERLLPLRPGLHARVPRDRRVRGRNHPPAALARGSRLRGQARRRDRQRRDGGDARPGDGP